MQTQIKKSLRKIFTEFNNLNSVCKKVITLGTQIFLALLALGTLLVVLNRMVFNFDSYIEFVANSIIKASFTVFAEIFIGSLVLDHLFKRK